MLNSLHRHLFVVLVSGRGTKLICTIFLQNTADPYCTNFRKCVVFVYRLLICSLSTEAVRNSDRTASNCWIFMINELWGCRRKRSYTTLKLVRSRNLPGYIRSTILTVPFFYLCVTLVSTLQMTLL